MPVSGLQKMARLKTPLALALLSLAVPLGCASRPLVPSESVRLGQNEGILVIHTDSPLQFKLRAEGFDGVWKQDSGDQISLVVVPAREYRWRTIWLRLGNFSLRFTPPEDERWSFRVRSGTICYPGSIQASERGRYGEGVRTINRSAVVLQRLEQDFATLLDQYPLAYTGHVQDDFLEHYWNARRTELSMSPATEISAEPAP